MEVDLGRVRESFARFRAALAPSFGYAVWQEHARDYMRALLVQCGERRNAENLGEAVDVPARVMQWFLTQAGWDDDAVIERLQDYLAPRLNDEQADWIVDESALPKQGKRSAGVARQYCGHLGKVASCQLGVFLAHVGPRGRAIMDKTLYLPARWIEDPERCKAAGTPDEVVGAGYQGKAELALSLLRRAKKSGALRAGWVLADDNYGRVPLFPDGVAALGYHFMLEVPSNVCVWLKPDAHHQTSRYTTKERAARVQRWVQITVAEGAQGPRTYLFAFERLFDNPDHRPARSLWAVYRKNLDGSEPRCFLSNAPLRTRHRDGSTRFPADRHCQHRSAFTALAAIRACPGIAGNTAGDVALEHGD